MFPVEAFQWTIGKFVQIASAIELPFHLTEVRSAQLTGSHD